MRVGSQAAARGGSGRVKRRLFNVAAAVSLVLCVATAVLWARSFAVADLVGHAAGDPARSPGRSRIDSAYSVRGIILIYSHILSRPLRPSESKWYWQRLDAKSVPAPGRLFPFSMSRSRTLNAPILWSLRVSHWLVVAVAAVTPCAWVIKRLRRRRQRRQRTLGLCQRCGYDLRAHSGGDRCPECGAVPATAAR